MKFAIRHPNKSFVINQAEFKSKEEAEAHMKLINSYAKEWVKAGMTQEEADTYVAGFKVEPIDAV